VEESMSNAEEIVNDEKAFDAHVKCVFVCDTV